MKSHVLQVFQTNVDYLRQLIDMVKPEQMALMPKTDKGVALNPPAWQLGHLAVSYGHAVQMFGGKNEVPPGWEKLFGGGSKPTDKLSDYPSKTELLDCLARTEKALHMAIASATDAKLAEPNPNVRFRKLVPTLGDVAVFMAVFHSSMHVGQLTSWLRCVGTGPRF